MQEELISFETAKLAKKKGFELNKYLSIDDENPRNLNSNFNPRNYQPWYFDLTQSLLQKWLREVHGIYVNSDHDLNPKGDGILYHTNWGYINAPTTGPRNTRYRTGGGYSENEEFKTYEEALEVGLQEALKLI